MPPSSPAPRRARGFTLIELLVVISIIALMIGILLPALGSARDSARTSVCLSQIRQVGLAMAMYVDDAKARFPAYRELQGTPSGGDDDFWPLLLIEHGYIPTALIYKCPNLDSRAGWPDFESLSIPPYQGNTFASRIHYGYNFANIGGSFHIPGLVGTEIYKGAKIDEINQPAATLVLGDSLYTGQPNGPEGFYTLYDQPVPIGNEFPDARHAGRKAMGINWVDGHTSSQAIADPLNPWAELGAHYDPINLWDRK